MGKYIGSNKISRKKVPKNNKLYKKIVNKYIYTIIVVINRVYYISRLYFEVCAIAVAVLAVCVVALLFCCLPVCTAV